VLGGADEMAHIVTGSQPDVVFIAIPAAPAERLDLVRDACHEADVECLIVRREIDRAPSWVDPASPSNVRAIHTRGRR
jgi:hypothetical protein